MSHGLSKSRLMSFRQCPRRLWLEKHRPELATEVPGQEAAFATGHAVGDMARQLYDTGGGLLIDYDDGLQEALRRTAAAVQLRSAEPVFEATFERDGLLVRVDVLQRARSGARLIEVKASTSVKPEHVVDCAIQSWVLASTPVKPKTVVLAHVDNSFVYQGDGRYHGLLAEQDLTEPVAPLLEQVPAWLRTARRVLAGDEPAATIGTRCSTPYECPFKDHCWPKTEHSIADLPGIGKRLDQLLAEGHHDLRELPEEFLTTPEQRRVWRAARRGTAELSLAARQLLRGFGYPRFYLDFETASFAVPRWAGTRPYQQIPFQWSLHTETSAQDAAAHQEFIDLSGELPARAVATSLLEAARGSGPVFMYTTFEKSCLRTLATLCPDLRAPLEALSARLVDLLPIAKQHYYHPAMHGSWSIKKLLPTIAPQLAHSTLDGIQEGAAAQQAFVDAISGDQTRRDAVRQELLAYCRRDTLALVAVARYLEGRPVP